MPNRKEILFEVRDYMMVCLGAFIYAIGVTLFLLPYKLATGGLAGVSALIYYGTGLEIEISYALLNVVLLLGGAKILGLRFCIKTLWGFGMITFWLWVCQRMLEDPVTHQLPNLLGESDKFLACIIVALMEGLALAICFHYRGSTGGTDIIVLCINKFKDVSLGTLMIFTDIIIVTSSYFVLHDAKKIIFGYVILVLSGITLDFITRKFNQSVVFHIFSRNYRPIADALNKAGFGVTVLDGFGWYTKTERKVLMCVSTKRFAHEVMEETKRVDPTAFVSVVNAEGVYGEGFAAMKTKIKGQKPIIVFATNNEHKLTEVRQILADKFEVRSLKEVGCDIELPETHNTLRENALEKAQYVRKYYGFDCFADDTGLEVDALDGAPGVFSARYANIPDPDYNDPLLDPTKDHDSQANMRKLLAKLEGRVGDDRKAQFKTVIALIYNNQTYYFEGIVRGTITTEKHGSEGFGYDPIFKPDGFLTTFAEMPSEDKNLISHRGRAVQKLVEFLKDK